MLLSSVHYDSKLNYKSPSQPVSLDHKLSLSPCASSLAALLLTAQRQPLLTAALQRKVCSVVRQQSGGKVAVFFKAELWTSHSYHIQQPVRNGQFVLL